MKKRLVLILSLVFILTGCSSTLLGQATVKDLKELSERKEVVEEWLSKSTFLITEQDKVGILTEKGMGKRKVEAPPRGSVFSYYQDIATTKRDGFLSFTSTQTENEYLVTLMKTCDIVGNKKETEEKAFLVAERLSEKIKKVNVEGINQPLSVIHRTTAYNWDKEKWEEKTGEIYIEDVLNTAYALWLYGNKSKEIKYVQRANGLLDTVNVLQKDIEKNQKEKLHGAVYYRLTDYEGDNKYKPSWDSYPFTLSFILSKWKEEWKQGKELNEVFKKYHQWLFESVEATDFWNESGVPYIGMDGQGNFIRNLSETWKETDITLSEEVFKVSYALDMNGIGKSRNIMENPVSEPVMGEWAISKEITQKGKPKFNSDRTVVPLAYIMEISKRKDDVLMGILSNQRMKGNSHSKGAWQEGTLTDIRGSMIVIQEICKLQR